MCSVHPFIVLPAVQRECGIASSFDLSCALYSNEPSSYSLFLYATVHANTLRGCPNGCSDMLTWNGMSDNTTEKPQHHGKKQMFQMCEVRDLIMDAPKS